MESTRRGPAPQHPAGSGCAGSARRDKIGFAVPIHAWLPAMPDVLDLLQAAARLPTVRGEAIEPYLGSLRSGQVLSHRASFPAWRLVGLAAWVRHCNVTLD